MTKLAQVIFVLSFIFFSLLLSSRISLAFDLIRPIPDETAIGNLQPTTDNQLPATHNQQLTTNNYIPSITFGDLLAASSSSDLSDSFIPQPTTYNTSTQFSASPPLTTISSPSAAIQQLLAQLEASYQESQDDLAIEPSSYRAIKLSSHQAIEQWSHGAMEQSNNELSITNYQLPITISPSPTPFIPVPTLIARVSEIVGIQSSVIGHKQTTDNRSLITDNRQLTTENPPTTYNTSVQPSISPQPTPKSVYTIALLGDSMTDTLGKELYHLKTLLKKVYPAYNFALLNYGQGATDLESGLYRLTNTTTYLGQTFPPLLSYRPDILVVESFAYNHWGPDLSDLNRQWLTIARIIDAVKANSPETKIILAATIAPDALTFGDGSLNWPAYLKWNSAQITKAYLQNLTNFATSQGYPLADAYHPSLGPDGNGLKKYINAVDNLHPSGDGGFLFAQKIVEAIKENNLIK